MNYRIIVYLHIKNLNMQMSVLSKCIIIREKNSVFYEKNFFRVTMISSIVEKFLVYNALYILHAKYNTIKPKQS